jgi:pilus assembly protein CpaF
VVLRDLVRQALRMRPDRLVVGEVRGPEVTDLLAALNTGHEGGSGTVHANAAQDVPARLEALGAGAGLDRAALHSQLAAALDVVVHVARGLGDGVRRVTELHVLTRDQERGGGSGLVRTVPAAVFGSGGVVPGPGWPRLLELCARRGVELDGLGPWVGDGSGNGAGAAPGDGGGRDGGNDEGGPDVAGVRPESRNGGGWDDEC